jgi:hypothetical protein
MSEAQEQALDWKPECPTVEDFTNFLHELATAENRQERISLIKEGLGYWNAALAYRRDEARITELEVERDQLLENRDKLRVTNHKLSRERDSLFKRKIVDSHAKVWLPYWRACRTRFEYFKSDLVTLQAELDRLRDALASVNKEWHHDSPSDCYSTGPHSGDFIQDYVACPGCQVQAKVSSALASPTQGAPAQTGEPHE